MKTIKLDRWNISQYDDPSPFVFSLSDGRSKFNDSRRRQALRLTRWIG